MYLKTQEDIKNFTKLLEKIRKALNFIEADHGYVALVYDGMQSTNFNAQENELGDHAYTLSLEQRNDFYDLCVPGDELTPEIVYDILEDKIGQRGQSRFALAIAERAHMHDVVDGRDIAPLVKWAHEEGIDTEYVYFVGNYWTDTPEDNWDIQSHHIATLRNKLLQGVTIEEKTHWVM